MTEEKLRELLNSMTLEEKLCEMWQPQNREFDPDGVLTSNEVAANEKKEDVDRAGSTLNLYGIDRLKKVQDDHIKNNPHHIPLLFMGDVIHGFATIYPNPLASSCSFDMDLIKKYCAASAKEMTAAGVNVTYYPMIDLVRDPRWGRVVESAGEDPYVAYNVCKAVVEGLQGDGFDKPYTTGACVKHFAGYGGAEGGRDYNSVELSERAMREYYLKGYKGGVDAGACMIMTSYNTVGGVPSTCNKWLFRDILRDEWKWEGVVITDLWALSSMCSGHGIGDDSEDPTRFAAKMALEAGIDIEMGSFHYKKLAELVRKGEIDEKLIDEGCWRCLKLKNDMGLFENPYRYMSKEACDKFFFCDEHLDIARRISTESCVLLKNEDKILPLSEKSGKIAFMGPFIDLEKTCGAWVVTPDTVSSIDLATEVSRRYPELGIKFAKGCSPLGREQKNESERFGNCDEETREQTISEAVELARTVDTVVMTLGEITDQSGESRSRANIRIPDVQLELFNRVYEVNPNIVVLLYNGRPLDLSDISDKAKAILDVWYLGTKMNAAIVDLVFGESAPSGKLTMSFPRSVAQIPTYYNHLRTDHRVKPYWSEYIDDCSSYPLYPFGFGLTYTELKYGKTTVDRDHFKKGEKIIASCEISNVGDRDCVEIVELYTQDRFGSVARPVKELKGFKRVPIKAGETVKVDFEITEEMLRYWNIDMVEASDPGLFKVLIAHDSGFEADRENVMTEFYLDRD